jgi:hypothetical protein
MSYYGRIELADVLIGKTVNHLLVSADESQLVFETDGGDVILDTEGDCCSETWFADVLGFDALIGSPVESVYEPELSDTDDGRTRQESDRFYGYKITTAKGVCDIIYRNSSNGYYGGESYVGSTRLPDLREITADWRA